MTEQESKQLKVGDIVQWGEDSKDIGFIESANKFSVEIAWDNGMRGFIDHRDMAGITKKGIEAL